MSNHLSSTEKEQMERAAVCTDEINKGLNMIEGGLALIGPHVTEIKKDKLWRFEAKSWAEYCGRQKWSKRRFDQIISSWDMLKTLPENMGTVVPTERAARELAKVPSEARKDVLESVLQGGEKVTSETIKKASLSLDDDKNKKPRDSKHKDTWPVDMKGTPIPPPCWVFWDRRDEVQPWLTELSRMKSELERAMKEGDSLYAGVTNIAIGYLSQSYSALSQAKKYAVCTVCQGWWDKMTGGGCSTCNNTGLISKYQYDHCSRPEVKTLREKSARL